MTISNPTQSAPQSMPVQFSTSSRCILLRLVPAVSSPWFVGSGSRSRTVYVGPGHAVLDFTLIINGSRSQIKYVRCLFHQSSSGLASSKSKCHKSLAMVIRISAHASLEGIQVSSCQRPSIISQPELTPSLRMISVHAKMADFRPCHHLQIRSRAVALATSPEQNPSGA